MTQSTFFAENIGSKTTESPRGQTLRAAINRQLSIEKASFHTPGHKGRVSLGLDFAAADLTELPGLDELAYPRDVLKALESRISTLWKSRRALISVNGASAALSAAIISSASRGKNVILPRNAHRAALSGLVLSGLNPIWYEASWMSDWNTWGSTEAETIEELLKGNAGSIAAVLVCSPNYCGAISDIKKIAEICKDYKTLLIVDEAHGAHLFSQQAYPANALECGADIVIHSLHKTLSAPTQTGLLHIAPDCAVDDSVFCSALSLLQSSSPSYALMLGIENAIIEIETNTVGNALKLAQDLRSRLAGIPEIQILNQDKLDPLHIVLKHENLAPEEFYDALANQGIFAETIIGDGVLLLLGTGSVQADIDLLIETLKDLKADKSHSLYTGVSIPEFKQKLTPREAFFANSKCVEAQNAVSCISSDWIAPCPPGHAIVAPGQEIGPEIFSFLSNETSVRVVKIQLEGDSDGPNAPS